MKKSLTLLATTLLCLGLMPAFAQMGRMPGGPNLDGAMKKLFGDNQGFIADLETQIKQASGDEIIMPGKVSFDTGNSRFEIDLNDAKGLKMPPNAAAQMKSMGLDHMISITLPKKNLMFLIYPGLNSYVKNPLPATNATNDNFKVETTEMGKGAVDGHDCVQNKVVVTGGDGTAHEFTVWNATDMKKFPLKITNAEQGNEFTMSFKNVSLTKPAASAFEVPASYTAYDNVQTMMQTEMMKKMGGGAGGGFGAPPKN
jgi:hypothetical protein